METYRKSVTVNLVNTVDDEIGKVREELYRRMNELENNVEANVNRSFESNLEHYTKF